MKLDTPSIVKGIAKLVLAPVLAGVMAASANSAPLWNLNLDSMTVDQTISTASYAAGVTNVKPQSVGTGSALIRNNYAISSGTLAGHSVVLSKSSTGSGTAAQARFTMSSNADYTASTDYQLSFDALFSKSAFDTATSLNIRMINDNSSTSVGALVFQKDGGVRVQSAFGTEVLVTDAWTWGEVTHFVLQIDATNKLFKLYINNESIAQLPLDTTGKPYPNLGISRIWFGANSDNSLFGDGIGISGIVTTTELSVIPEPKQAAILGLGAGIMLLYGASRRAAR